MSSFDGRRYPSDLTNAQWAIVEPLIPKPSTQGRPPYLERRVIVNAILYVLRSGCPWRLLPFDFPAWQTVYYYFRQWQRAGVWDQMLITDAACRCVLNRGETRNRVLPPSIANPSKPAPFVVLKRATIRGKKVWGRKRHVLVDTEGNLLAVKVTGAEQSDQQGGKRLLLPLRGTLPRLQLIWGDSHFGGTFVTWLKEHLGWKMQTVLRA